MTGLQILTVGLGAWSLMVVAGFGVAHAITRWIDERAASDTAPVPPATVPRPVGAPPPRGSGIAGCTHAFQYDHTDLPPGVTALNWRRHRHTWPPDRPYNGDEVA